MVDEGGSPTLELEPIHLDNFVVQAAPLRLEDEPNLVGPWPFERSVVSDLGSGLRVTADCDGVAVIAPGCGHPQGAPRLAQKLAPRAVVPQPSFAEPLELCHELPALDRPSPEHLGAPRIDELPLVPKGAFVIYAGSDQLPKFIGCLHGVATPASDVPAQRGEVSGVVSGMRISVAAPISEDAQEK
jgi:hypothetical protein